MVVCRLPVATLCFTRIGLPGGCPRRKLVSPSLRCCINIQKTTCIWECAREEELDVDEFFMRSALQQAQEAFRANEVPIGAVLVHDKNIVSRACNEVETRSDPTAHAEILCIRRGAKVLGWRLHESTLYVTAEPCPMCAGAVLQGRIARVVYGTRSPRLGKSGAHQSWISLLTDKGDHGSNRKQNGPVTPHPFHPAIQVQPGILELECSTILKSFFQQKRMRHSPR